MVFAVAIGNRILLRPIERSFDLEYLGATVRSLLVPNILISQWLDFEVYKEMGSSL